MTPSVMRKRHAEAKAAKEKKRRQSIERRQIELQMQSNRKLADKLAKPALSLALWLCLLAPAFAAPYADAHADTQQTGKPLIAVVGASWCPHCVALKARFKQLEREGSLDGVNFAYVDYERELKLAEELMDGDTIPQTKVYTRDKSGKWKMFDVPLNKTSKAELKGLLESLK